MTIGARVIKAGSRYMAVAGCVLALGGAALRGQAPSPKDLMNTMLGNERYAAEHRDRFTYLSNERSERTGGHMWTERVVETPVGRVRLLMAEDGKPISPDRAKQEFARLDADAKDPTAFTKREAAQKDDETHARSMLELIPKGFLLENLKAINGDWRMDFKPDPAYSPATMEEKVLHGMEGWLLIDQKHMRLQHIEGRLPKDVSLAFGLASVHAGSNFESTKQPFEGQWRTVRVISDIRGKAALFKTLSRNQDVTRSEFKRVDNNLTVAQAVALVER